MDRKGTGWVPDFPDVKDYTLNHAEIQALAGQVQTERSMGAVEDLTKQVSQVLKLLATKRRPTETESTDDKAATDNNRAPLTRLEHLINQLDEKASGGLRFTSVNILRSFTPGMSAPEVLEIKQCLQKLYSDLPELSRNDYLLNPFFDELTAKLVEDFKRHRGLGAGSIVDIQTMDALRWSKFVQEDKDRDGYTGQTHPSSYHYHSYEKDSSDKAQNNSFHEGDKIFSCLKRLKDNVEGLFTTLNAAIRTVEGDIEGARKLTSKFDRLDPDQTDPIVFAGEVLKLEVEEAAQKISEGVINSRNTILDFLEENGVRLTPAANKRLNLSQADNLEDLLVMCGELETIDINILQSEIYSIGDRVDRFIVEASYLPLYLPAPKQHSTGITKEEVIQPVTTDSLLAYIFTNLIPENDVQRIEQLIKPVVWSEYEVVANEGGCTYSDFVDSERHKGACRLREQFLILRKGPNLQEASAELREQFSILENETSLKDLPVESEACFVRSWVDESIKAFAQEHSIPEPRDPSTIAQAEQAEWDTSKFEYYVEKAAYHDAVASEVAIAVQQQLAQLLQPIVEVIVRLVLPLGQYANYRKAAEIGIAAFRDLVTDDSSASLVKACDNNSSRLKDMALVAVQKVHEQLESQNHPLIKDIIQSVVSRYRVSGEQPKPKRSSSQPTVTAPLLEVVAAQDRHTDYFDLKIPINWNLHRQIQAHYAQQPKLVEGRRDMLYLRLPEFVDLSLWCSAIEDQGSLNACTAHAGVALTEYFAKRSFGKYTDVSPLFLYKTARNLMQRRGDSGASLRETMKAMVLFGIPPEEHWPYDETRYDEEPTQFCYSFAQNYQALKYFRLDYAGIAEDELLIQAKAVLAAGFPCMFGFTLYTSAHHEIIVDQGHIPYPDEVDQMEGGHAVVAVGYDDSYVVENADGKRSQGAILIRNSWGAKWGRGGYGWLPYDYVLAGLTADWWSLLKSEWFESGQFGVGAGNWSSNVGRPRKGHH